MKIAMIINSSSGLYNFRKDLISRLVNDGNEVIALTPFEEKTDLLLAQGIRLIDTPIDRRGVNPLKDYKLLRLYIKIIKREHPDLVITYTIKPNIYAGLASKKLRVNYAANVTGLGTAFEGGGIVRIIATVLNRIALSKAKCVFFENRANLSIFVNEKIIDEKQAVLLNGAGVNLQQYQYKEYPENVGKTKFLFMGRIMREKGVEELFAATKRLIDEGADIQLTMLGRFEERYEDLIKRYEKEGWLKYEGYQPDVRPFITDAHCFVLPSWHEGMANTNLESAAMGRPVITSDIPGCQEAVLDDLSGILCKPKDVDSLYNALKTFINLPYKEKEKMGLVGRKHMEATFDKEAVISETVRHLYG